MNVRHLEKCPVCGSVQLKHFLTCTDCYATGENFHILKCSKCGFKMTQDVPVEAEIGRYYESPDYISHTNTRSGIMNRVYHWVRSYMLKKKAKLVEEACHMKKGRILDIGCGTGYFAHTMQQRDWDVEAIEKSADARAFAWQHFNLNVLDESHMNSFNDRSFNAITMWHVMEHIEDLPALWSLLKRQLQDQGRLIVAVPNCSSADAAVYNSMWAAYDVPRHLWHFTPDTMQQMASQNGFVLCERYPMPFDAFYVSMLSEKYLGNPVYFLKGLWTGAVCGLKSIVRSDRSSSIIYVFRKKK
ncbi:MAG: class I SAM-dependent methyltransferase [Bacteroidaceae bacterium]|nr:class I SAM-dependent methyltransferase [Bacteroidaceae bacterium]